MTEAPWQPSTTAERYRSIDILRGLALFGVLMVNLETGFRVPLLEHILRPAVDPAPANHLIDLLVAAALEFKAITIFSLLFGVGIAIQFERAAARNVNARSFLVRRMLWLFLLGTVHLFLVWNGDILALYGVCGLLLLPFLGLRPLPLFLLGAAALVFQEIVPFGMGLPGGAAATAQIAQAREIYAHAGFPAILRFRWQEAWSLIMPLLIAILPRTVGLMYWGMALWRSHILREPARHRTKLLMALAIGATVGGAIDVNHALRAISLSAADFAGPLLLAMAYASGVLLWLSGPRKLPLPGIAALGQMALTNYLVQSVVLGFIFYGYGFGLFGRIGSASGFAIGVALYAAQVQFSRLWLRRFRFGPFEWLWRSLAYGQRQEIVRSRIAPS